MKWIGQHIWDFISRFRSDVYLEATETGTIASGGNLGLDSNNKIVKAAEVGSSVDLTSAEVTGVLTVDHGGTGASSLTDNAILTGTGASPITAESTLTYSSEYLKIESSAASKPVFQLSNSNTDDNPSILNFIKTATGSDSDGIGKITFTADNDADQSTSFASIRAGISGAADTDEAGNVIVKVACSNGTTSATQEGLNLTGSGSDNKIDVGIGFGATSLTTIAGDLDIDGDNVTAAGALTITPGGTFTVAGGSNEIDLTTTGTLDVNANALAMDLTDASEITLTASEDAENLLIRVAGDHDSSLILRSDGTGDDALQILTTAGSLDIDSGDNITVDAADNITLTTAGTDGDGRISLISGVASANTAIHLDGNANANTVVDIDAGVLDIDVEATADILAATSITLQATKHTIDTIYDFHGLTFENGVGGAVDKGTGKIIKYEPNGDSTPNGSEVYYLRSNGAWLQADASGENTSKSLLAVGLGVSSQTGGLLLEGFVRISAAEILNIPALGVVDGLPVYLSTTSGHFDFNAPSGSGDIVRILGYAIDDDGSPATEVLVYFNPDKTYIEIA